MCDTPSRLIGSGRVTRATLSIADGTDNGPSCNLLLDRTFGVAVVNNAAPSRTPMVRPKGALHRDALTLVTRP